jgi:2-keto-3-deoxy-L-rhamnonate aldolase RhmA
MRKTNRFKTKLEKREFTLGSWITLGHPSVAEIMVDAGYEWLTVDMEHSAITLHQAQQLVQIIELGGVVPLVRVGINDANLIKRVMDAGAYGVIVPMVNTKEDARKAVYSVKYPPLGTRGVGLARAQGYGQDFPEYKDWNNENSVVIVQIEHIKGVENMKEILTTEGVDGFIIGPYDLSGSLKVPGQFDHPDVVQALKEVQRISKELDALAGFHYVPTDTEGVIQKMNEGYRFIAHSLDILFLGDGCRTSIKDIRSMM